MTVIDPTCGSGHFLLGAFELLRDRWNARVSAREAAERALAQVYGVDINPFAVAIARFRLLLAFLRACGYEKLRSCPAFIKPRVATGDSLLVTDQSSSGEYRLVKGTAEHGGAGLLPDATAPGDHRDAMEYLFRAHAAVVGNPPYKATKDKAQNASIRKLYATCHGKFILAVPFTERFFQLAAVPGGGFIGMITANSFMKRDFGKKLIPDFFPTVDLSHVLDVAGAYIPGHGTPPVILFGRARPPSTDKVRAVLGIRGEPGIPERPAEGKVWRSVVELVGTVGAQNDFVSVADLSRESLATHPWSMGGGGALELKELLEENSRETIDSRAESVGYTTILGEDETAPSGCAGARTRAARGSRLFPSSDGDARTSCLPTSCRLC